MKATTSTIHFETRRDNKTRWVKQAQMEGSNLRDWVTETLNQRCYDYNIRAIRGRVDKPREVVSGKALHWLKIAAMIATRKVNSTQICAELGFSRNSFVRHQADMERIYGFAMEYMWTDKRKPGWYEITDWGVLDEQQVIKRYGSSNSAESNSTTKESTSQ